jgi:carbon storage regulator
MLVLSRMVGERLLIGDEVVVVITQVRGNKVRLGIEAPPEVLVLREELVGREPVVSGQLPMAEGDGHVATT